MGFRYLAMRSILLICALLWTASMGAFAESLPESNSAALETGAVEGESSKSPSSVIPEPTATLLAGLGGLALLFFATRRKVG